MCVAISTRAQINNFDFILTCKKKEKSMRNLKYSSTNVYCNNRDSSPRDLYKMILSAAAALLKDASSRSLLYCAFVSNDARPDN